MKHYVSANRLASNNGDKVEIVNVLKYLETLGLIDFDLDDLINKRALEQAVSSVAVSPVSFYIPSGDPVTYFLTSDQVTAVNNIARVPNFVALVNGEQFPDIKPIYAPAGASPGAWTSISVTVHDNGSGGADGNTLIQFS